MYGQYYDKDRGFGNIDFPKEVSVKIKETFYKFSLPLYCNNRLICSKKDFLSLKYSSKDIFIFGGGGSTNRYFKDGQTLSDIQEYDAFWSLNNFYKNKTLENYPLELISLGPEVDLNDEELWIYLQCFQPNVGIELHQKWSRESLDHPLIKEINDFNDYSEKFCFQTRYFTFLGSGVRLIILACELGAKSVSFIGFDGPDAIWKADHAFEEGKNFMTYRMQGFAQDVARQMFQAEYDWFWNYCKETYPDTKIISIDKTNNMHRVLNG